MAFLLPVLRASQYSLTAWLPDCSQVCHSSGAQHQGQHGGLRLGALHVHQLQGPDHHDIQMLRTETQNISAFPFEQIQI